MKHVSVIQHTQSEWLGAIEDHLEGRGIRFSYFRPFTADGTLPDGRLIGDGLILLGGGPWGAAPGRWQLPTLEGEVRLARAGLMLGLPVLGFGLGAQILSLAADGGVEPSPLVLEAGWTRRVADEALGGLMPEQLPAVVYMRDRPLPPGYAGVLARDAAGRPAAFQIGPNAFGFTSHPAMRRAMVEDLLMEGDETPPVDAALLDRVGALTPKAEDALVPLMAGIVAACGWM